MTASPPGPERRRRHLGIRARAALAAAIAALLVAAALSSIAWFATQSYLVRQRESSGVRQAFLNARLVQDRLTAGTGGEEVLGFIRNEPGGLILLRSAGTWFSAGVGVGPSDLPRSVLEAVEGGVSGQQLVDVAGRTRLVVVVALDDGTSYVEIFGLDNLRDALDVLRWSLIIGSLLAATRVVCSASGRPGGRCAR